MSAEVPRSSSCCWMMLQYLQGIKLYLHVYICFLTFPAFAFDGFSSDMTRSMVAMYDVSLAEIDAKSDQLCMCYVETLLWKTTSYARKALSFLDHCLRLICQGSWATKTSKTYGAIWPCARYTMWQSWRHWLSGGVCVLFHVSVALMVSLHLESVQDARHWRQHVFQQLRVQTRTSGSGWVRSLLRSQLVGLLRVCHYHTCTIVHVLKQVDECIEILWQYEYFTAHRVFRFPHQQFDVQRHGDALQRPGRPRGFRWFCRQLRETQVNVR